MEEKYEQYEHHGNKVWVRLDLKGNHREHCLCYQCKKSIPDDKDNNCPVANLLYAFCVLHGMVTPVWECPSFEENPVVKVGDGS